MESKKRILNAKSTFRQRIKSPKVWLKAATSAKHKASELVKNVRSKLESPNFIRRGHVPRRRSESVDRSNSNFNNTDQNSYETSSVQTTSTSSSTHSGFLSFALPTTVNPNDPLPQPTCRLGAYQAEWLDEKEGVWKLVTQNAAAAPVEQVHSTTDLRRRNRALKREQEMLKTKLSILYDELAKKTALVHQNDEQLEKLRQRVKEEMGITPESMRSSLRKEMEEQVIKDRKQRSSEDMLASDEETVAHGDVTTDRTAISRQDERFSHQSQSELTSAKHEDSQVSRSTEKMNSMKEHKGPTGNPDRKSHHRDEGRYTSSISVSSTSEVTINDNVQTTTNDTESEQTETTEETLGDGTEEEQNMEDEVEEEEDTEDEEADDAESAEDSTEEEEVALSDTEESESQVTSRRRVVQFGKVSRR